MNREAIIVVARAPEPGRVKTRLIPTLGAEGACRVHESLLEHTLTTVAETGRAAWFYVAGERARVRAQVEALGLSLRLQSNGDLGERMAVALAEVHGQGFERVALIGSDCPVLDRAYLEQALMALEDTDFVLGPAEDGGYVLLGSAAPAAWSASLLAGVRFGGPQAEADTLAALYPHGRVTRLHRLWDVDEPGDWARARALAFPPADQV